MYKRREKNMKLNIREKDEGKVNVGLVIYYSDKIALDEKARSFGINTSTLLRSLINDVIDGNIKVDI